MKPVWSSVIVSFIVSLMVVWVFGQTSNGNITAVKTESIYDRVMRTGTLRCGYFIWPPHFMVDPNTGEKSGEYYDIIEELGRVLNLKIEWTQEYVLGTQVEALKSSKIDALCADGPWTRSAMPYLNYSRPYMYIPGFTYVKKGNKKIKDYNDLARLNSPDIMFTAIDGDGSQDYLPLFPKAKLLSLSATADVSMLIQNVLTGKADAMLQDPSTVAALPEDQKNQLVRMDPDHPFAVYPFVISVQKGEEDLLHLLDQGIDFINYTGAIRRVLHRYDPAGDLLYVPPLPYEPLGE